MFVKIPRKFYYHKSIACTVMKSDQPELFFGESLGYLIIHRMPVKTRIRLKEYFLGTNNIIGACPQLAGHLAGHVLKSKS